MLTVRLTAQVEAQQACTVALDGVGAADKPRSAAPMVAPQQDLGEALVVAQHHVEAAELLDQVDLLLRASASVRVETNSHGLRLASTIRPMRLVETAPWRTGSPASSKECSPT